MDFRSQQSQLCIYLEYKKYPQSGKIDKSQKSSHCLSLNLKSGAYLQISDACSRMSDAYLLHSCVYLLMSDAYLQVLDAYF